MTKDFRRAGLYAWLVLLAGLAGFVVSAPASAGGLLVVPAQLPLGVVDASVDPFRELSGGLSVFLPPTSRTGPAPAPTLVVTLRQPLKNVLSGATLPADRVQLGVDTLQTLPSSGTATLPVVAEGMLRLRVAIQLRLFDAPGIYEGRLTLARCRESGAADSAEVPVRVEVSQWAAIRLSAGSAAGGATLAPAGTEPGPVSFLSSGEESGIQVASNCRWKLSAQVPGASDPKLQRVFADLRVRVRRSDWVEPVQEGFLRFSGEPVLLATGGPTASCGSGWVPITYELQLPFSRSQVAGRYTQYLAFSVSPR